MGEAPAVTARDAILAALGADAGPDPAARRKEAATLLLGSERPPVADGPPDRLFLNNLSLPSVAASHEAIASLADLPDAVARYLAAHDLPPALYLPPDPRLDPLGWGGIRRLPSVAIDGGAALGIAVAAVAETGSLVMQTAPTSPMLPNFLALHHLVLVDRASVVAWLEDVPLPPAPGPRTRYWITGVSGTTDIEGQYVRGAHGPRFLHVILNG